MLQELTTQLSVRIIYEIEFIEGSATNTPFSSGSLRFKAESGCHQGSMEYRMLGVGQNYLNSNLLNRRESPIGMNKPKSTIHT